MNGLKANTIGTAVGNPPSAAGRVIAAAGLVVLFISLAAAFLPLAHVSDASTIVAAMLLAGGMVEIGAGAARRMNRWALIVPGAITFVAGALLVARPLDNLIGVSHLLIGWLGARGIVLLLAGFEVRRSARLWSFISGGTDLALAAALFGGLIASIFPIMLFGETDNVVAGFAVLVAISFVTTAMLLFEIATCDFQSSD